MNFVQWLSSLDELLYEAMSWLLFFPITLWRILLHPLSAMRYAEDQLLLEPERQYRDTVSPPIMLILAVLIGQAVDISVDGTNAIVASRHGLAGLVNDNTTLLLLRTVLFGLFALTMATRRVRRSGAPLDRDTLKPAFYAQCYAASPFVLLMGLGFLAATHWAPVVRIAGLALSVIVLVGYGIVQIRWFRRELAQSVLRSTLDASLAMVESIFWFGLIGVIFVR